MKCNIWMLLGLFSFITGCSSIMDSDTAPKPRRWAAYYNYEKQGEDFADYELIVTDASYFPPLEPIQALGTQVYGYVSIGEVRGDDPVYQFAKEKNLIIGHNADWDSHIIDIREPWWHKYILEFVMPALEKDGFDGVMFDTITSPFNAAQGDDTMLEMHKAAVALIRSARERFPNLKIMVNRGFAILPEMAPYIDATLAESILAVPDETYPGQFRLLRRSYYDSIVAMLHQIQKKNPHLTIYSLDYWQMDDKSGTQELYKTQRDQGFIPYISTPDLRTLHIEE